MAQLERPLPIAGQVADPGRAAAGWVMIYGQPGILTSIDGIPAADWTVQVKRLKEIGDTLGSLATSGDTTVVVTVRGRDAAEVTERLDNVIESTEIKVVPPSARNVSPTQTQAHPGLAAPHSLENSESI